MTYTRQFMDVQIGSSKQKGCLLVRDGVLVALLVKLTKEDISGMAGKWFLETQFGLMDDPAHPIFDDLDDAESWLESTIATV